MAGVAGGTNHRVCSVQNAERRICVVNKNKKGNPGKSNGSGRRKKRK